MSRLEDKKKICVIAAYGAYASVLEHSKNNQKTKIKPYPWLNVKENYRLENGCCNARKRAPITAY